MTLREAINVAWNIRTLGLDGVSQDQIRESFAAFELAVEELTRFRERESLVTKLLAALREFEVTGTVGAITARALRNVRAYEAAVRDFGVCGKGGGG
jgi:hypothetical protein